MPILFDQIQQFLFPHAIPLWQALGLVALSFFTSFMSASVGIGGGTALLGVLASVVPVNTLIAVHAFIQMGSNTGRTIAQRAHVQWKIVRQYAAGGIVGALAGGLFFVSLPESTLLIIIGVFILWMVWGPKITIPHIEKFGFPLLGMTTAFLSTMLGTAAALTNATLRRVGLKRQELIGTQAACVLTQHFLKVIVFVWLGVAIQEWLGLIILMILVGFVGTWAGTRLLNAIPEHLFDVVLKVVLTLVAANLIRQGIFFTS